MNKYITYQELLVTTTNCLATLRKACARMEMEEQAKAISKMQEHLKNHTFRVGIIGGGRRGKSTVINALLGEKIVPVDVLPTTAAIIRIVWGERPHAVVHFKEKTGLSPKEIHLEELDKYVTTLTPEAEEMASKVEEAVVYYPCEYCKNGVEIVDTPGLNNETRLDQIAESVIPSLDAVIMVLVPGYSVSRSDYCFIQNKLLFRGLDRVIFVVNKIDTIRRQSERVRAVGGIRDAIKEKVLAKTESMYGRDSEEYNEVTKTLAGISVFGVSAADALDGRLENDEELLRASGFTEFESELARIFTEERGLLELSSPVGLILSRVKELESAVAMRTNALGMKAEEFSSKQKEAMERIKAQREEKEAKVKEVKELAESTPIALAPMVEKAYASIEDEMVSYVKEYTISPKISTSKEAMENFKGGFSQGSDESLEMVLVENIELIKNEIRKRVQEVIENQQVFSKQLTVSLEDVVNLISNTDYNLDGKGWAYVFLEHVPVKNYTNFIPMVVSKWEGREIVDRLINRVLIVGGYPVVGNPQHNFLNLFPRHLRHPLTGQRIQWIRSQLVQSVRDFVSSLSKQRTFEKWLEETSEKTFGKLSTCLEQEAEQALQGMHDTLVKIEVDLAKSETNKKAILDDLQMTKDDVINILKEIKPIRDKLEVTLNSPSTLISGKDKIKIVNQDT